MATTSASPLPADADGRCLRQSTRERKHYSDEPLNDDDIEGKRSFNLDDHLSTETYNTQFVHVQDNGENFSLKHIQKHGLFSPLLFREKNGLGMRVPSKNFKVSDVKQCVGSRRHLDVMDVNTQKGLEMTMKDWVRYYENPSRERLLNVISLEFSHTKLENYVESPSVVRQIDWVDSVWPRHLKECQTESTNLIDRMKYPKVQKYCLMSVKGCYTDFHIDFGGTSVWYHILHGEKIFWLIPPTDVNLRLYEDWVLSGKQGDMFFGEQVQGCQRIRLQEGNTFMIPSGWIHAVYTPTDSLVFGGNFLHSFNIPMQIRISEVEDRTHVPGKFRYPFMGEIHWYVLDRYVACLRGKSFRTLSPIELKKKSEDAERPGVLSPKIKIDTIKCESDMTSPLKSPLIMEHSHIENMVQVDAVKPSPSPPVDPFDTIGQILSTPADTMAASSDSVSRAAPNSGSISQRVNTSSVESTGELLSLNNADCNTKTTIIDNSFPALSVDLASAVGHRLTSTTSLGNALISAEDLHESSDLFGTDQSSTANIIISQTSCDTPMEPATPNSDSVVVPPDTPLTVLHIPDDQATPPNDITHNLLSPEPIPTRPYGSKYLTKMEIDGLRFLIRYLEEVPPQKAPLPKDINEPQALLNEAKAMLVEQEEHDEKLSLCGEPVIFWLSASKPVKQRAQKSASAKLSKTPKSAIDKDKSSVRRRRTRCKKCEACTRQDCGECHFCKDMRKFGGLGRMKQSCISRQCMAPVLPNTAMCGICQKEERMKGQNEDEPTSLMECGICWEIVHPQCLIEKYENLDNSGNMNEDLPNSWECPKCCHDGKRGQLKPRVPKGVSKIGKAEHGDDDVVVVAPLKQEIENVVKEETGVSYAPYQNIKPRKTLQPLALTNTESRVRPAKASDFFVEPEPLPKRRKRNEETTIEDNGEEGKITKMAAERFVIRPAPLSVAPSAHVTTNDDENHVLDRSLWMRVFRYLGPTDLYSCLQVCRTFDRWCIDRSLWRCIDLSDRRLTKDHLMGIVRRQPSVLVLAKCNITSKQLQWLLCRLPLLRHLDLSYCSWSAVAALTAGSCPWLEKLKLDWVEGLGDDELGYLLSSASCHRPAVKDTGSRLRNMRELSLVGTDITGNAISYISQFLPSLLRLDLSHCPAVTTNSFDSPTKSPTFTQLNTVVLAGCRKLNSSILDFLNRLPGVKRVDLTGCSQITDAHIMLFNEANRARPFRTLSGKILYRD